MQWYPTQKRPDPVTPNKVPECPKDDNTTYTATDGTFFRVRCERHTKAANSKDTDLIRKIPGTTFQQCMELCSREPGCLSIDYVGRPNGAPPEEHVLQDCYLYRTGAEVEDPTVPCGTKTMDMAYPIDPPEEEHPDEGSEMCSTECPFANGQIFDSAYGERFHIDCAKRHGTKVLSKCCSYNRGACVNV